MGITEVWVDRPAGACHPGYLKLGANGAIADGRKCRAPDRLQRESNGAAGVTKRRFVAYERSAARPHRTG